MKDMESYGMFDGTLYTTSAKDLLNVFSSSNTEFYHCRIRHVREEVMNVLGDVGKLLMLGEMDMDLFKRCILKK